MSAVKSQAPARLSPDERKEEETQPEGQTQAPGHNATIREAISDTAGQAENPRENFNLEARIAPFDF
ncbi:unnamed protein product [Boreogadus saida]